MKSSFELGSGPVRGEFELYLFMPGTMHLSKLDKNKIVGDFNSRIRLSIPRDADGEQEELQGEFQKLRKQLQVIDQPEVRADISTYTREVESIFSICRHLGALVGELLKGKASYHRRELLLIHSLANPAKKPTKRLLELASGVGLVGQMLEPFREIVRGRSRQELPGLWLLDQYIYHMYIDYLGGLRTELDQILSEKDRFDPFKFENGWKELDRVLTRLQKQEVDRMQLYQDLLQGLEGDDIERELHFLRLSQMKKFFQSEMFVEVAQTQTLKKFSEPLAAGAAVFAAVCAAVVERMSHDTWLSAGFGGIFMLALGVAVYAFRDRLKDRSRSFFTDKLGRILPDLERELVVEGKKVGEVREWWGVRNALQIPSFVQLLREKSCVSEAEKHLPEDVFHFRREFDLRPKMSPDPKFRRSLQETLRINIERYLKYMDDAVKTVRILGSNGQFSQIKTHRVYHFYICLLARVRNQPLGRKAKAQQEQHEPDHLEMYRVVVDKNGLTRVEPVLLIN